MDDIVQRHCELMARREAQRLEQEAVTFLKMGFTVDELVIVVDCDRDYEKHITPKSAVS